ncbi:MAG TPA: T9SS type A sorting domain-containing protein [Bacteroidia bacterium]|nr:T9SS type A sorting domain-containing protein [Bacteroidia bacterium]
MKMLTIIIVLILFRINLFAQDWEWVLEAEGIENLQTASDEKGNLFASGNFKGSCRIGTTTIKSSEKSNCFVLKFNDQGNIMWWKTLASTDTIEMIELKARAETAYIGGSFTGKLKSGSGNYTSAGGRDIFIASYDGNGNLQLIKTDGGPVNEEVKSIDISSKKILLAGSFTNGGKIANHNFASMSTYQNAFFATYDFLGTNLIANEIEVSPDTTSWGNVIEPSATIFKARLDHQENIILVTSFSGKNIYEPNYEMVYIVLKFNALGKFVKSHTLDANHIYNRIIGLEISDQREILVYMSQGANHSVGHSRIGYLDEDLNRKFYQTHRANNPCAFAINGKKLATAGSISYGSDLNAAGLLVQSFNSELEYSLSSNNASYYSIRSQSITISNNNLFLTGACEKFATLGSYEIGSNGQQFLAKINSNKKQPLPEVYLKTDTIITCVGKKEIIRAVFKNVNSLKWEIEGYKYVFQDNTLFKFNPEMTYYDSGKYSASVVIRNTSGEDSVLFKDLFIVDFDEIEVIDESGQFCYPYDSIPPTFYMWHKNDSLISYGAYQRCFTPDDSTATYHLIVSFKGEDCWAKSQILYAGSLNLTDHLDLNSFFLYPNPVTTHFIISFEGDYADLTIAAFSGKNILNKKVKNKEQIEVGFLSKGIYFVQVIIGKEVVRRKLLVN